MPKTKEELIAIHKELHTALDKLIACYIDSQKYPASKRLSNTSVMELLQWSAAQLEEPSCFKIIR